MGRGTEGVDEPKGLRGWCYYLVCSSNGLRSGCQCFQGYGVTTLTTRRLPG